jgi:hypothetical protein
MRNGRRATAPVALAALLTVTMAGGVLARGGSALRPPEQRALTTYAADTWASFVAMTDPATGLPADNIEGDLDPTSRSRYTSPTNIGAYMWSTLAARDLGIITAEEARSRLAQTLATLATLERHVDSGMFYNWYDPVTGAKLTTWPPSGDPVYPFLSSVDWLAAALMMVVNAEPSLAGAASAILAGMDFGFYYDPGAGLLRGGFWVDPPPGCSIRDNYRDRGADVYYTCHHYGALNTEPRIASYIAIALEQVPEEHYFRMWRTFPATCDWGWHEMQPTGETHTYLGVSVFEGTYQYAGMRIVPSWGGSMFEALMVPLLVPEEEWGPTSWGVNHPLYVDAQIHHGLKEARYGYWGFSPSNNPDGGYREYGVDPLGMEPNGYASDQERTHVDYGFGECRPAHPLPESYGRGVVTPHASFLALEFAPHEALKNLDKLARNFDAYGPGGFYDAIDVVTGTVSKHYLALDQGMVMLAIANALTSDAFQSYFTTGPIEAAIQPLLALETFTAGRASR